MEQLGVSDWFGLLSFMVAVLSLAFNGIQWRKQRTLEKDISQRTVAGMNSGYQALWRIAELCDKVRGARSKMENQSECASFTYATIQEITGCVDTGRAVMNSICRDLVGERLHYEAPWFAQKLVSESNKKKIEFRPHPQQSIEETLKETTLTPQKTFLAPTSNLSIPIHFFEYFDFFRGFRNQLIRIET